METLHANGSPRAPSSTGNDLSYSPALRDRGRISHRHREPSSVTDYSIHQDENHSLSTSCQSVDDGRFDSQLTGGMLPSGPATAMLATHLEVSNWHSAPLAFALLPAVAGMIFQNGGAVVTDFTLLAFAGVFLNWSVRMPWDWYHSSQSLHVEHQRGPFPVDEGVRYVNGTATPGCRDQTDEQIPLVPELGSDKREQGRASASAELYKHEILALIACFLLPLAAALLLHEIRGHLSRPSEGLVSNYNLTIFLLTSEIRPTAHLLKIIQARTFRLQRTVHSDSFIKDGECTVSELMKRLERLEARLDEDRKSRKALDGSGVNGDLAAVSGDVHRTLQPDLDALNRAVRRYEKRATLQTMQTESRLLELETRLQDAISLAAAVTQSGPYRRPFPETTVTNWAGTIASLPIQAMLTFLSLPVKASTMLMRLGRALMVFSSQHDGTTESSRSRPNGRVKDRSLRTSGKRIA